MEDAWKAKLPLTPLPALPLPSTGVTFLPHEPCYLPSGCISTVLGIVGLQRSFLSVQLLYGLVQLKRQQPNNVTMWKQGTCNTLLLANQACSMLALKSALARAHLGVEVLQDGAEVGREEVVARGRPLAPLDEGRPRSLQHIPARHHCFLSPIS